MAGETPPHNIFHTIDGLNPSIISMSENSLSNPENIADGNFNAPQRIYLQAKRDSNKSLLLLVLFLI